MVSFDGRFSSPSDTRMLPWELGYYFWTSLGMNIRKTEPAIVRPKLYIIHDNYVLNNISYNI